ncbi:hypothetical protein TcCL_NonESM03109 [Trypanosoma cruzi]|nr:hypothetical protein TcCL_NonESM03109 [Trypanosoma cruzi]
MSATPNAYWRTCSMRCNHTPVRLAVMHCILSFCLEQTLTFSRSTAWELREAAEWCHVSEDPNVRKQRPPSLPHKSSLPSLSRTQGRCHVEGKPAAQHMHRDTHNSRAINVAPQGIAMRTAHTQKQGKRDGASPNPRCSPLLLSSPADWHCVPHPQMRHGAHSPLLPSALSRPPPSHPPAVVTGNRNNRRRGPSVPLAEKKKWGHFNRADSRGTVNGTSRHTVTADTVTMEARCSELPKKKKK